MQESIEDEAEKRYRDAVQAITGDQYDRAETILRPFIYGLIPKGEVGDILTTRIREQGPNWFDGLHFSLGMTIRNELRSKGFTDKESKSGNLDDIYQELLLHVLLKDHPSLERCLGKEPL